MRGDVFFTEKALEEIERDDLTEELVVEAILNAPGIAKRLNSANPQTGRREKLFVIVSVTFDGVAIYTKGKVAKPFGKEVFYVLISSKKNVT